jgi:hypothetical protein
MTDPLFGEGARYGLDDLNRHHTGDHDTSIEGARAVNSRATSQRAVLLQEFAAAGPPGLTDEEAALAAGLTGSCYWKRCGELRRRGLIEFTDESRVGDAGVRRKVSRVATAVCPPAAPATRIPDLDGDEAEMLREAHR